MRCRTWTSRLVPAVAGRSSPGRGFQRGEGPFVLPATVKSASHAGAGKLGSLALFSPRPTVPCQAAASSKGRGRTPSLATGQIAQSATRPRAEPVAQSRLPVIRRRVPTLREQAARTSAP
ncbi:hypothetical protein NDU88_001989 [Pleurodeles waltl]|uniref:Uncharacterized protein n=1 Tax=Pleurodeles waltl TaxID=8319 RepID=A0AAV7P8P1_PLEWA|nr:hypothetical protein NDU88_001989 [Pleurodeles waltl]